MPSNAQLRSQAASLAEQLGEAVETQGKNNNDLTTLVSELKARIRARAEEASETAEQARAPTPSEVSVNQPIDGADRGVLGGPPEEKRESPPIPQRYAMQVAKGRCISGCLRGPLGPGDQVRTDDFTSEVLKKLIAAGTVIVGEPKPYGPTRDSSG